MTNDRPKRSRLEDEVLEILSKADRQSTPTEKARSHLRVVRARRRSISLDRLGAFDQPWGWFGLALILFIVGGGIFDEGIFWQLIRYAGLAALIIGIVRLFRPSPSNRSRKTWRGRPIDMSRPGFEMRDKFDDWRKRR